jgi:hypothetical protein
MVLSPSLTKGQRKKISFFGRDFYLVKKHWAIEMHDSGYFIWNLSLWRSRFLVCMRPWVQSPEPSSLS